MTNKRRETDLTNAVWERVMALPVELHEPTSERAGAHRNAAVSAMIATMVEESISKACGHMDMQEMDACTDRIVGKVSTLLDGDYHVYTYDEKQGDYRLDLG